MSFIQGGPIASSDDGSAEPDLCRSGHSLGAGLRKLTAVALSTEIEHLFMSRPFGGDPIRNYLNRILEPSERVHINTDLYSSTEFGESLSFIKSQVGFIESHGTFVTGRWHERSG